MERSKYDDSVPENFQDRRICVIGLGFVGLTLGIVLSEVGFRVSGIEIRSDLLAKIAQGNPCFFEPGIENRLKKILQEGRLEVFPKIPKCCEATVYIITVGTPLKSDHTVSLHSIQQVCEAIAENLKDGDLILLRSTVKLGITRSLVFPIFQRTGKKFQLAFCPERTIEGQALSELRYLPQIIGTDDLSTSMRAAQLFQFLTPTTVRVRDYETAEMIKLIDNTRRDVTFAFSNEVARLCSVAGLNVEEVISSGRFGYSRTDLPMPGPVGGPCLSKDPHILVQSMAEYGIVPEITSAARKVNEEQPEEVVSFLKEYLQELEEFPTKPIISLLGIAFKGVPATDDIRGTTAKPIFEALKRAFPYAEYWGFDPVVSMEALEEFGLLPKATLLEAVKGAHLVLILNNHPLFSMMQLETLSQEMAKPALIYDFWNFHSRGNPSLSENVHYIALGSHKRPIVGKIADLMASIT
jgi:UDP-N-acetyl-D-mannosaminuronic acid dehydrogenase